MSQLHSSETRRNQRSSKEPLTADEDAGSEVEKPQKGKEGE